MKEIPFHEFANLFQDHTQEEIDQIAESISSYGQIEPVVILDGLLLDGRGRYKACVKLGREPDSRQWGSLPTDGDDPLMWVICKNVTRRETLPPSNRIKIIEKLLVAHPNFTDGRIASIISRVSPKTVKSHRSRLIEEGVIPYVEELEDERGRKFIAAPPEPKEEDEGDDWDDTGAAVPPATRASADAGKNGRPGHEDDDWDTPPTVEARAKAEGRLHPDEETALSAGTKAKAATPKDDIPVTDCLGNAVPRRLRDIFADTFYEVTLRQLKSAQDHVRRNPSIYPYLGCTAFFEEIEATMSMIVQHSPYCVCPECGGKGGECKHCRTSGFMSQQRHTEYSETNG